jgi:hypothetical protein
MAAAGLVLLDQGGHRLHAAAGRAVYAKHDRAFALQLLPEAVPDLVFI